MINGQTQWKKMRTHSQRHTHNRPTDNDLIFGFDRCHVSFVPHWFICLCLHILQRSIISIDSVTLFKFRHKLVSFCRDFILCWLCVTNRKEARKRKRGRDVKMRWYQVCELKFNWNKKERCICTRGKSMEKAGHNSTGLLHFQKPNCTIENSKIMPFHGVQNASVLHFMCTTIVCIFFTTLI